MFSYTLRRLLWLIPVIFTVGLITFMIMRAAPGGPFDREPERRGISPAAQRRLEAKFALDKPMWRQFTRYMFVDRERNEQTGENQWVCGAICGNLGPTYASRGSKTVESVLFASERNRPSRLMF